MYFSLKAVICAADNRLLFSLVLRYGVLVYGDIALEGMGLVIVIVITTKSVRYSDTRDIYIMHLSLPHKSVFAFLKKSHLF